MEKNVIVMDEYGNMIGRTYAKRAKGLIKHGRAVDAGEHTIRLTGSCPSNTTEDKTMNALYIEPRSFRPVEGAENNIFTRSYITSFLDGKLQEALMLGDWQWNWSEIASGPLTLQPNTEYVLAFWLNGGENDQYNETCDFRILFTNDVQQTVDRDRELIYKLNRNYIRPVKKVDGWELYEIPFHTEDKQYTYLKFVAMRAPMAILPAGDAADYIELEDSLHPLAECAKQRPNMVFEDGYPKEFLQNYAGSTGKNSNSNDLRSEMLDMIASRMEDLSLDVCTPFTADALKEIKDMMNMLLREE